MTDPRDKELGLDRKIDRRDFLNGMALVAGAGVLSPRALLGLPEGDEFAPEKAASYYPPALTGLRGSTDGTFEAAHALKDGLLALGAPVETGESYDLVVVGAGISGLSTAHFFRRAAGPSASVLLLDNHDDFGGHARRNEFRAGDRLLLGYGGTQSIDSPAPYSAAARGLIEELGIDVPSWKRVLDRGAYEGLGSATFFDRETFGEDKLVRDLGPRRGDEEDAPPDSDTLRQVPLSEAARRDILRLESEAFDPWPDLTSEEKKARLLRMSYADFLKTVWKLDQGVLPYYQTRPHGLYGVGIDAVPALDGWGLGLPGFKGLKLAPGFLRGMNRDAMRTPEADAYYFHFPDGNATVARLLVRRLLPAVLPGSTAEDVVNARADYGALDVAGQAVRLRLNSTVVRVKHVGDPASAKEVEVLYLRGGKLRRVTAKRVVLACWSAMIPHLCPEMPAGQREALAFAVKVPNVYTNVLVRSWSAFRALRVARVTSPGAYWRGVRLDFPIRVGAYASPRDPESPIVVTLSRSPCAPGLPARDQHRLGRQELLNTAFVDMERKIRDLMARCLAGGGFDPARDILAVTVNRWPHGYAYQYNALFDPFWVEGGEPPCVRARKPFGRVFVANSDADAYAYTDCAIDQAHRAVTELRSFAG
jgi:spermidine dehydrogenase